MPRDFLQPKQPAWLKATAAIAVVSLVLFVGLSWWSPWRPGRFWGLTFGTLAALIFLFEGVYPLRRRLMARPLGTAQRWLQLHIYAGTLAGLFVLIHAGFRLPGGQFGWWLLLLTFWTLITGFFGVLLQKWIPSVIARSFHVEALMARIPELVTRLQGEADKLMDGSSEAIARMYLADVRPALAAVTPSWNYLLNVQADREQRLAPLQNVASFVDEEERAKLDDLKVILQEKLELDAHYSLQRALRWWLVLHVPAAMMLLALVAVHIFAVWYL